jgi:hypothetical protein
MPNPSSAFRWRAYGEPFVVAAALLATLFTLIPIHNAHLEDFQIFRLSAVRWAHGLSPYAGVPNNNGPAIVMAFWPFAVMAAWPTSACAFLAVSVLVTMLTLRWGLPRYWGTASLIFLAVQPSLPVFRLGQLVPFLMFLWTAAWNEQSRGRSGRAAALLGVLMGLKPFYGVMAVYWLLRYGWRATVPMVVSASAVLAAGLLAGPHLTLEWLQVLQNVAINAQHPGNASIWGISSRLFAQPYPGTPHHLLATPLLISPALRFGTYALGVAAMLVLASRTVRYAPDLVQWSFLGVLPVVLSPFAEPYYLLVPFVTLVQAALQAGAWSFAWSAVPFLLPFDALIVVPDHPESAATMLFVRCYLGWAALAVVLLVATQNRRTPGDATAAVCVV